MRPKDLKRAARDFYQSCTGAGQVLRWVVVGLPGLFMAAGSFLRRKYVQHSECECNSLQVFQFNVIMGGIVRT